MLPLYCRLPHAKVKRRFDEVSKVAVVGGLARVQAFRNYLLKSGDIGYILY